MLGGLGGGGDDEGDPYNFDMGGGDDFGGFGQSDSFDDAPKRPAKKAPPKAKKSGGAAKPAQAKKTTSGAGAAATDAGASPEPRSSRSPPDSHASSAIDSMRRPRWVVPVRR